MTPDGWSYLPLGTFLSHVCSTEVVMAEREYPLLGVRWYGNGCRLHSQVLGSELKTRTLHRVSSGCVTYNKMWTSKTAFAVVDEEYDGLYSTSEYPTFTPEPSQIDTAYLRHVLCTPSFTKKAISACKGTTSRARLAPKDFLSLEALIPPLPEQKKIAEILGSVDEAIAATRAVIEQTRKVKQGLLAQLLTRGIGHTRFKKTEIGEIPEEWEVHELGDLALFVTSGSRGWAKYYSADGPLFLRSQNVRNGILDFTDRQHVNPPSGAEGERTRVEPGDLLITVTGNSVGNVAYVPAALGEAYVSQHVGLARLRDAKLHLFVSAYFSPDGPGNKQILGAQYGQSKPGLSLGDLRDLLVPIPSRMERERIEESLRSSQDELDSCDFVLEQLCVLKRGLMQDLLTGRVRTQNSG